MSRGPLALAPRAAGPVPVADPIAVEVPGDAEGTWWATLLAHLYGLRAVYIRLNDGAQRFRASKLIEQTERGVHRVWGPGAPKVLAPARKAATDALASWPADRDPLPLETSWWALAAGAAHACSAVYLFHQDQRLGILTGEIYRGIRGGMRCALPDDLATELIQAVTGSRSGDPAERVRAWIEEKERIGSLAKVS